MFLSWFRMGEMCVNVGQISLFRKQYFMVCAASPSQAFYGNFAVNLGCMVSFNLVFARCQARVIPISGPARPRRRQSRAEWSSAVSRICPPPPAAAAGLRHPRRSAEGHSAIQPIAKRQRAGAVQDAGALLDASRMARSVLDCGGPPPLFTDATANGAKVKSNCHSTPAIFLRVCG